MSDADEPNKAFDFIVVGGGTAGCLLANKLASRSTRPSILLIEAGGNASDIDYRSPAERYYQAFTRTELDHGYITTPQNVLNGRTLPYTRGKGLGGTSLLNFMVYTTGSAADYDQWGDMVGDDDWSWERTLERYKNIETFHDNAPNDALKYCRSAPEHHGKHGPVDVSLPSTWEEETKPSVEAAVELGIPVNMDINSGDPVGVSIAAVSMANGLRTTSASANKVFGKVESLTVLTNTVVTKILFEDKEAKGVETTGGQPIFARKEIILCAGAIDTPKLLLLSGVGPAEEIQAQGIKVVHDLPGVGKNLQDHAGLCLLDLMDTKFSSRATFRAGSCELEAAREQWKKDGTGLLATNSSCSLIAFVKDDSLISSSAFKSLDHATQDYIKQPTCPHFELYINGPPPPPTYSFPSAASFAYLSIFIMNMNPQSRGSITLASSSPSDPPLIDFNYATHPFDKLTLIHAVRAAMQFRKTHALKEYWRGPINTPSGESDEEIWEFIKQNLGPVWHANGTVKMGKSTDELACVGPDLLVRGVQNLRVADLSVCPLTPTGHTQAPAYLIGAVAAEKIVHHWQL
ncbi:hypothetical protein MMC28_003756 [Mycoblastus sanguinarius]|nr:hypothetical protein [Mycoblastus sanguinarius]